MIIYLLAFAISCYLMWLADNKICNRFVKKIVTLISLLIPCLLAGLRNNSVGTDVNVYVNPLYSLASNAKSFGEYLNGNYIYSWVYHSVSDYELLFNAIIYYSTKITSNLNIVLFIIEALIVFPLYFGLTKYDELKKYKWFSLAVFYFMFYNMGLNAMRQYIGISIFFYGFSCLINNKKGNTHFLICLLIACLFHKSSLLGLIIYALYFFSKSKYSKIKLFYKDHSIYLFKVFIVFFVIIVTLLVLNNSLLISILTRLGLEKYIGYVSGDNLISIKKIIVLLPIIFIFCINKKDYYLKNNSILLLLIFIMSIILSFFSASGSGFGLRISFIFTIFYIVFIPLICLDKDGKIKKYYFVIMLLYLMVYWYYYFVYGNVGETVPYIPLWK